MLSPSYLTVDGFLRTLYLRVRLTGRYLELLLDCSRHEFLIEETSVQQDWASNVEALRWLAGPIYRLTSAFRAPNGETDPALAKELRRQEGRLKAFYGLLCEVYEAYNSVREDALDVDTVRTRHQHLQISLNFLVGVCNDWLGLIVDPSNGGASLPGQHRWRDTQFLRVWDDLTSLQDVPPDFRCLESQVIQVNTSASSLSGCSDVQARNQKVLSLCMETRRLLLMLVFHLLTSRPSAHKHLQPAVAALEAATSAAGSAGDSSSLDVQTSINLLRQRCNILLKLASGENTGTGFEMLDSVSIPELAANSCV
jgi:hypothetical protein